MKRLVAPSVIQHLSISLSWPFFRTVFGAMSQLTTSMAVQSRITLSIHSDVGYGTQFSELEFLWRRSLSHLLCATLCYRRLAFLFRGTLGFLPFSLGEPSHSCRIILDFFSLRVLRCFKVGRRVAQMIMLILVLALYNNDTFEKIP